jgi:outer membrane protein assembly factor BamB
MQPRSRRALLRAAAVAACGAVAGCAGQRPETLRENCTEGLTEGSASAGGTGRWAGYGGGPDNAASTAASGPDEPALAWRHAICSGRLAGSSPLVADGRVYVTSSGFPGVQAFDAVSGELLWKDEPTSRTPRQAYADGTLYVVRGGLLARDGSDGSVEWTFTPEGDSTDDQGDDRRPRTVGSPTVADGTVFVTAGVGETRLFSLDAADGSVRWVEPVADELRSPALAVGPEAVYVARGGSELVALDGETGSARWSLDAVGEPIASLAVDDGRLFVRAEDRLAALTSDGETVWTVQDGVGSTGIAVDGDRVYAVAGGTLSALGAETGETLWTAGHEETDRELGRPVVGRSRVYVGRADSVDGDGPRGAVTAVDRESGDREWRFTTRGIEYDSDGPAVGTEEQIAVGDGTLYFTTGAGDLYAVTDG